MNICTIIAKNYVAHARVLAESFQTVEPEGRCSVLVIDDFEDYLDPAGEPFELVGVDEIGLPDPEQMAASYDVVEFSTAVKPWFLRHLLGRPGAETVTYLDPDIWIAGSLAEIHRKAKEHEIVLTPHFTAPLPRDGLRPSEEDILIAGTYNLGFISLGAGETASSLLDWWSERLERHCVVDPERGHFVDQRWIDLVPGLWPGLFVLRDPGYNIAYWNLPARKFEQGGDGYLADGQPLRFFHFSGFDPRRPRELSRHQNRIDVARSPALSQICSEYADRLLASGYEETRTWPYGWDSLPNGIRLDGPARRLHRQAVEDGALKHSVFSGRGAKRFTDYLTEVPGSNGGATRYAHAVRDSRADLRQAFPDIEGADRQAFARWMHEHAAELGIPEPLLPPAAKANGAGRARPTRAAPGVNLFGYLESELGVGEAARQVRSALEACEVPAAEIDVPVEAAKMPKALGGLDERDLPFEFNLVCVNADMLPELAGAAGPQPFEDRHTAGLWFWEVSRFPERWRDSFDHVDEVWAASEHVAEAIRTLAPVPVATVRIPVAPTPPAKLSRDELGMPEGFCFLFVFDHRSVFKRKNPLGIVDAFSRAFEPGSGTSLVIKSVSGELFPAEAEALEKAAAEHPDVHLVGETLDPAVKNAMIQSCDCYVSLHRSEGLGLTMAEAMYFERPVIATAYSGNLDFMTAENSYLVEHSMAKIGPGADPYPAAGEWAEPDIEHAAELMAEVYGEPELAAERGRRAGEDIRRTHSPRAAGELLEARIAEVRRARVLARFESPAGSDEDESGTAEDRSAALIRLDAGEIVPEGDPASGRAQLHHLLRFGEPPPRRGSGRFRAFAKRLYMRLLRPYASHQQRIDISTAAAIDELSARLGQVEGRAARGEAEIRRRLEDDVDVVRGRIAAIEAKTKEERERWSELGEQQHDLEEQGQRLEKDLGEQTQRLQRELKKRAERLQEDQRALEAEDAKRTESLQAEAKALAAKLSSVETELQGISDNVDATFERDRTFVDALRTSQERSATHLETELAALRARAEATAEAVQAANATPYMADDRFSQRTHPLLGEVIGFSAGPDDEVDGYRGFEDLFRGPEKMIRERQKVYLDLVAGFAPVLDAGCGRGEFLDLLEERGIESHGVDLDPGMVERCREKGHQVEQANLLDRLEGSNADSLGTVFSAQVIEHLDREELQRLLELSLARLRPGGLFIAETVNPHSPAALKSFWVDPSHRQPLFPETMLALCQLARFGSADVFFPLGSGDWEADRLSAGEYAVVAVAPERNA